MASVKSIAFGLIFFGGVLRGQIPVANGGTGASTAAGALSNLGAAASTSTVPSGAIMFIKTGTCPTGWTQESGFIGLYILATTAAAGDVGTTGGSTSYTPAGSSAAPTVNSLTAAAQTFTGASTTVPAETVNALTAAAQVFTGASTTVPAETVNSLTAAAQVFTGSSVTSGATSAGTPVGTVANGVIAWPLGVPTIAAGTFTQPTFTGNAGTTGATTGGTPAGTVANGTIAWPAGVPAFSGSAGTVPAQVFTGSSATTSAVSGGTPSRNKWSERHQWQLRSDQHCRRNRIIDGL